MAAPRDKHTSQDGSEFPSELQDRLSEFDKSLTNIEEILLPLFEKPLNERHEQLSPLDKAKLELTAVYAINSLFWMYLNARGENPKEHAVKQELDRVRSYMARIKEIQDKEKAPKLNKDASKRFVRNALWQAAHAKADKAKTDQGKAEHSSSAKGEDETAQTEPEMKKRKAANDAEAKPKKKKKKKNQKK